MPDNDEYSPHIGTTPGCDACHVFKMVDALSDIMGLRGTPELISGTLDALALTLATVVEMSDADTDEMRAAVHKRLDQGIDYFLGKRLLAQKSREVSQ